MLGTAAVQWGLSGLQNAMLVRCKTRIAIVCAGQMVWRMLRLPALLRPAARRHHAARVDLARQLGAHAGEQTVRAALAAAACLFFAVVMLAIAPSSPP